jgi:hypothetical protein
MLARAEAFAAEGPAIVDVVVVADEMPNQEAVLAVTGG